jgi:hypothetical protein
LTYSLVVGELGILEPGAVAAARRGVREPNSPTGLEVVEAIASRTSWSE